MIKTIAIGVWAAVVALGSTYAVAMWSSGGQVEMPIVPSNDGFTGLEYRKPAPITVPMIADGRLRGYVVAKVVYTANGQTLHAFPVDPTSFVLDEAFRRIYTEGRIEFDQMSKYNLEDITTEIKASVNKRLGGEIVHDVLIEELNYVDKDSVNKGGATEAAAAAPTPTPTAAPPK